MFPQKFLIFGIVRMIVRKLYCLFRSQTKRICWLVIGCSACTCVACPWFAHCTSERNLFVMNGLMLRIDESQTICLSHPGIMNKFSWRDEVMLIWRRSLSSWSTCWSSVSLCSLYWLRELVQFLKECQLFYLLLSGLSGKLNRAGGPEG